GVQVPAVSSVQGLLLQVRQEERPEAMEGALWKTKLLIRPLNPTGRKEAAAILEIVQGQADLLEIVGTRGAVGGLAHLRDRRQQERDQHGDDGNHYQQLDQRNGSPAELRRTDFQSVGGTDGFKIRPTE